MEMSGEYRIAAPRAKVWAALNDPLILKESIPGCTELNKISDTEMTATVQAKVGMVRATFNGAVTLTNLDPPNELHHHRRRQGRRRRLRQGRGRRDAGRGRARHDPPQVHRQGPGRRQARPDRRPPDRRHRQADGRPVLRQVSPKRSAARRRAAEARSRASSTLSRQRSTRWPKSPRPRRRSRRQPSPVSSAARRCGRCSR